MGGKERKKRFPDKDWLDIKLTCNADLNKVWGESGESKTPAERITVGEAIIVGTSRELEEDDRLQQSNN